MAWEKLATVISGEADEDLTNDQYRYVLRDATTLKFRRPNSAVEIPEGILQNAPKINEEAVVAPLGCGGYSKVQLGATLAAGAILQAEYVDAADAGKAIAAVATGYPAGLLVLGGAEDDLGTVLLVSITVKS